MKAIQITIDETLLDKLDRHPSVKRVGRSAVLRQAAAEFLARAEADEIARRYSAGYVGGGGLAKETGGWVDEGIWPAE